MVGPFLVVALFFCEGVQGKKKVKQTSCMEFYLNKKKNKNVLLVLTNTHTCACFKLFFKTKLFSVNIISAFLFPALCSHRTVSLVLKNNLMHAIELVNWTYIFSIIDCLLFGFEVVIVLKLFKYCSIVWWYRYRFI